MNIKNLQIMYDWLMKNQEKIRPNFDISFFRSDWQDEVNHVCGSQGCLIGWGVGAFPYDELPKSPSSKKIFFWRFNEEVLNMDRKNKIWKFIFDSDWSNTEYKSFDDAMSRFKHVLDGHPINEHPQHKVFFN